MKKGSRRRVSVESAKRIWERVKTVLEYAHLAEFLLHAGNTQVFALLLFALKWPIGWLALGWLLAGYFYLRLRASRANKPAKWKEQPKERDHGKCKPLQPEARKMPPQKGKKVKTKK
jgi:hypothetical protein